MKENFERLEGLVRKIASDDDSEAENGFRIFREHVRLMKVSPGDIGVRKASVVTPQQSSLVASAIASRDEAYDVVNHGDEMMDRLTRDIDVLLTSRKKPLNENTDHFGNLKQVVREAVKNAGSGGMSRDEIRQLAPNNPNLSKRLSELEDAGTLFRVDDRLVHGSFAHKHPIQYREAEEMRRSKVSS